MLNITIPSDDLPGTAARVIAALSGIVAKLNGESVLILTAFESPDGDGQVSVVAQAWSDDNPSSGTSGVIKLDSDSTIEVL